VAMAFCSPCSLQKHWCLLLSVCTVMLLTDRSLYQRALSRVWHIFWVFAGMKLGIGSYCKSLVYQSVAFCLLSFLGWIWEHAKTGLTPRVGKNSALSGESTSKDLKYLLPWDMKMTLSLHRTCFVSHVLITLYNRCIKMKQTLRKIRTIENCCIIRY